MKFELIGLYKEYLKAVAEVNKESYGAVVVPSFEGFVFWLEDGAINTRRLKVS